MIFLRINFENIFRIGDNCNIAQHWLFISNLNGHDIILENETLYYRIEGECKCFSYTISNIIYTMSIIKTVLRAQLRALPFCSENFQTIFGKLNNLPLFILQLVYYTFLVQNIYILTCLIKVFSKSKYLNKYMQKLLSTWKFFCYYLPA